MHRIFRVRLLFFLKVFAAFSDCRNSYILTYIIVFFTEELSFDRAFVRFEFGHRGEFLNK